MSAYVVAAIKSWNIAAFHRRVGAMPGTWTLVESPDALTAAMLERIKPRYVFFPHWSWKVPQDILDRAECVCFHMTDVPYGRGGSPLQNLIVRGHRNTMVSALRMVAELDVGPVYRKRPLDLSGSAQTIYERMADIVFDMIAEIVCDEPAPLPQTGEPSEPFARRTPDQSVLPAAGTPDALYDFIRMLDAETYPRAFLKHGDFRLEFSDAGISQDTVTARVTFKKRTGGNGNG